VEQQKFENCHGLIWRLASYLGVSLVEVRERPVAVVVVLGKGKCDSRNIEIKIAGRISISIFRARLFLSRPVNGGAEAAVCE
jgi:hypothetical protein